MTARSHLLSRRRARATTHSPFAPPPPPEHHTVCALRRWSHTPSHSLTAATCASYRTFGNVSRFTTFPPYREISDGEPPPEPPDLSGPPDPPLEARISNHTTPSLSNHSTCSTIDPEPLTLSSPPPDPPPLFRAPANLNLDLLETLSGRDLVLKFSSFTHVEGVRSAISVFTALYSSPSVQTTTSHWQLLRSLTKWL